MAGFINQRGDVTAVDATSFACGAFTPARNDVLMLFIVAADCVEPRPVITTSVAGVAFDLVTSVPFGPSVHTLYCYVSSFTPPTSRTITIDTSPTTSTAFIFNVVRVSNLQKQGVAAIRQVAITPNGAAAGTPSVVFPKPLLTGNAYMALMANLTNPNNSAGPFAVGNITMLTTGVSPPTVGLSDYVKNTGDTSTTLTWAAPSATAWGALAVELDATAYTSQDTAQFEAGIGV